MHLFKKKGVYHNLNNHLVQRCTAKTWTSRNTAQRQYNNLRLSYTHNAGALYLSHDEKVAN